MEYPHGHHHREEEDEYPPRSGYEPHNPPPPFYSQPPPPQPHLAQVHHTSHAGGGDPYYNDSPPPSRNDNYAPPPRNDNYAPPPRNDNYAPPPRNDSYASPPRNDNYAPPPRNDYYAPPPPQPYHDTPSYPQPPVQHVSHESQSTEQQHHRPHVPSFINDHVLHRKPSVRVHSKAESNFSLTIRDGHVILTRADPTDPCQHWIKVEKFSTKVKDKEGFPSFALVNKATGEAMKHSIGATYPVQLTPYDPDILDESVLWTESRDLGDGYKTIRMINNIQLNVDALNGDENHGGVHDGTTIVLWEWKKGPNQRWKITPYCKTSYSLTEFKSSSTLYSHPSISSSCSF